MTAFAYELAGVIAAQSQASPPGADVPYCMPWYLVIGDPQTGKTSAIKALDLSWPRGDRPLVMTQPEPRCSYWLPEKALFIEPGPTVLGPGRQPSALQELCYELKERRPREPIDGMLLVVNVERLAGFGDDEVERYATSLRRYLVEVGQALGADVPTYVVAGAYDTLWGFGDTFQWSAARRDEEPWGFSLRPDVTPQQTPVAVKLALEGLRARVEGMCFDKLSGDAPPDARARAFQHLSEALDVIAKLDAFMAVITMANAFERAPWVRALVLGSGTPGTGHVLRHRMAHFQQMGYYAPRQSGTPQPGGMPIHGLLDHVLLPERDIVPTRVRWRDDKLLVALAIAAAVAWIGFFILLVVRTLVT